MAKVTFMEDLCKGCELCTTACPVGIVSMDKTKINTKGYHPAGVEDMDKCLGCANCAIICPDAVIRVER